MKTVKSPTFAFDVSSEHQLPLIEFFATTAHSFTLSPNAF